MVLIWNWMFFSVFALAAHVTNVSANDTIPNSGLLDPALGSLVNNTVQDLQKCVVHETVDSKSPESSEVRPELDNSDLTDNGFVQNSSGCVGLTVNSSSLDTRDGADQETELGEGKLSDAQYIEHIRFVYQLIMWPSFAIPGCACNVINIYVLTRPIKKVSSNTRLLLALSIVDLLFLICTLENWAMYLLEKYSYLSYVSVVTSLRLDWNSSFLLLVTGRISSVLIVILSIERFIAVKLPFSVKSSPLGLYPMQVVLAVCAFVTTLLLPNLFRREFIKISDPLSNTTDSTTKVPTEFAQKNAEFYTIYTYIILVVLRLLPVVVVVVLNAAIIITLKSSSLKQTANQMEANKRQVREVKITRMLVAISVIFLVCVTPGLVHSLLNNFLPGYHVGGKSSREWVAVFYVFPLLDIINSTVNFFVYVIMIQNFRNTFVQSFNWCKSETLFLSSTDAYREENETPSA